MTRTISRKSYCTATVITDRFLSPKASRRPRVDTRSGMLASLPADMLSLIVRQLPRTDAFTIVTRVNRSLLEAVNDAEAAGQLERSERMVRLIAAGYTAATARRFEAFTRRDRLDKRRCLKLHS